MQKRQLFNDIDFNNFMLSADFSRILSSNFGKYEDLVFICMLSLGSLETSYDLFYSKLSSSIDKLTFSSSSTFKQASLLSLRFFEGTLPLLMITFFEEAVCPA